MRTVFAVYLMVIFAGLAAALVVGALGQ